MIKKYVCIFWLFLAIFGFKFHNYCETTEYFIIIINMEQILLDATDILLLDQLQQDASLTNQVLAERVRTSPPTCLRRVKRLRDAGLIERQIAILNTDKLARCWATA